MMNVMCLAHNMSSLNRGNGCNHRIIITALIIIDWKQKYAMKTCREKRNVFLTGSWGQKLRVETTFEQQLKKKKMLDCQTKSFKKRHLIVQ